MGKNKNSPQKKAQKFEQEAPESLKRNNIRISSPYGAYPEDVDKIIRKMEKDISDLTKENKQLSEELEQEQQKGKALQFELTQMKMQISLMEIPDVSTEESMAMLSRVSTITGVNEDVPVQPQPKAPHVELHEVKAETTSPKPKQATYSNLIRPRNS